MNGEFNTAMSKWGRFLLAYDPREDLMRMHSRVLALYGSKDRQVHAEPNAGVLRAIFHIFQKAVTGGVGEYSRLPREFVPGYLEAITAIIGPDESTSVSQAAPPLRPAPPSRGRYR